MGDKWQQTGNLEESNLCELEMKDKGSCCFQSYLVHAPFLCLACRSAHTTYKIRGGIEERTEFDIKKLRKIPENIITSTSAQDAH